MRHQDEDTARVGRQPVVSRAMIGRVPGLSWIETYVLKAICDVAMGTWERRLTLDQVEAPLTCLTHISRDQVEQSLESLKRLKYVYADDAPSNPEIVLTLTPQGLEAYCRHLTREYDHVAVDILRLVCQDPGADVVELAHRTGQFELLIDHVLDVAHENGMLRVARNGQYIVVKEVRPQLRRWISGAA
jgi:hypothetical protein